MLMEAIDIRFNWIIERWILVDSLLISNDDNNAWLRTQFRAPSRHTDSTDTWLIDEHKLKVSDNMLQTLGAITQFEMSIRAIMLVCAAVNVCVAAHD